MTNSIIFLLVLPMHDGLMSPRPLPLPPLPRPSPPPYSSLRDTLVAVSVSLAARAVTSCELAVTSCLVRHSMVVERTEAVLLSVAAAVARLAITSAISVSLLALFDFPNAPCSTAVFSRSS